MREAELIERYYRPARPRLDAARAVVAGCREPREAWDALTASALVPSSWRNDPRRWFWVTRLQALRGATTTRRQLCEVPGTRRSHVRSWPMTVAGAIALAADPDGVMAVEPLAREAATRLAAWDSDFAAAPPTAVVWRETVEADPRGDGLILAWEVHGVVRALVWPLLTEAEQAARRAWPRRLPWVLSALLDAEDCWLRLVAIDARVPARRGDHPMRRPRAISLAGRRFAELTSPFAPILEIFARGYAIAAVTADAIALHVATR